jgi:hypothetical protein
VKIAFWAIVVFVAGYAVISGLSAFIFGGAGTSCTSSTEGGRNCEWDWGAAATSGFYLVLFALLLFFSSRSLIQAIQQSGMVWRTEAMVWQALLVIGSLAALEIVRELLNGAVAPDAPCIVANPTGSVWMNGGRFDYVECTPSTWWEKAFPWAALLGSLSLATVSIFRLRHGRRSVQMSAGSFAH